MHCHADNGARSRGAIPAPLRGLVEYRGQAGVIPLGWVRSRTVGGARRRRSLPMAGRSRYGKTETAIGQFVALARSGHGGLFLDPHADTIAEIKTTSPTRVSKSVSPRSTSPIARPLTLVLAGPRAEEPGYLLWRDVDLVNRRLYVGRSKADAGLREIPMLPLLYRILATHKANCVGAGPDDFVFATSTGARRDKDNVRNRMLAPVLEPADELLLARGEVPLPKGPTPHKLRHTFASILVACGEDPASVMSQLGHTDPRFTLKVYSHIMRRSPEERARLKAYVHDVYEPEPPQALNPPAPSSARELVAA